MALDNRKRGRGAVPAGRSTASSTRYSAPAGRYSASHYATFDPNFAQDLRESRAAVVRTANDLIAAGWSDVRVPPEVLRPRIEDMAAYADDGDLFCGSLRIEVKRRNLRFTCPEDFPYDDMIVDVAHTWDRARREGRPPFAYVVFNKDMTARVAILAMTHKAWTRKTTMDRLKNRSRTFLYAPTSCLISWDALVECIDLQRNVTSMLCGSAGGCSGAAMAADEGSMSSGVAAPVA